MSHASLEMEVGRRPRRRELARSSDCTEPRRARSRVDVWENVVIRANKPPRHTNIVYCRSSSAAVTRHISHRPGDVRGGQCGTTYVHMYRGPHRCTVYTVASPSGRTAGGGRCETGGGGGGCQTSPRAVTRHLTVSTRRPTVLRQIPSPEIGAKPVLERYRYQFRQICGTAMPFIDKVGNTLYGELTCILV